MNDSKPIEPAKGGDETPAADAVASFKVKRSWLRKPYILTGIAILLIAGITGAVLLNSKASKGPATSTVDKPKASPTPSATPILAPLTGLPVSADAAKRAIVGVVIENHPDARPQSGLSQAGVVYEALAEGGITRFLAFYGDQEAQALGPIRSLRTYFVDWALEFNAPVAHAGGNADALDLITPLRMKDIDGLGIGAPTFYRVNDRYSPHNLYTSSSLLDAIIKRYGFDTIPNFTFTPRKKDEPGNAAHPNIHIDYSYNGYQVDYAYDTAANDYVRSLAGAPHIDRNTGNQIHVKNIVVQYVPTSYGYTRINEQTVLMQTVGNGKAVIFRDGNAVEGTWRKTSHSARTELLDAAGQPIPLNPGSTWYSILPTDKIVSY
jgi:hypothetical protein